MARKQNAPAAINVDPGLPAAMTDPAKLKPLLVQTLRTAILHYRCVDVVRDVRRRKPMLCLTHPSPSFEHSREAHPSSAEVELKLTTLMVWHR
jgi:hypothetical protein